MYDLNYANRLPAQTTTTIHNVNLNHARDIAHTTMRINAHNDVTTSTTTSSPTTTAKILTTHFTRQQSTSPRQPTINTIHNGSTYPHTITSLHIRKHTLRHSNNKPQLHPTPRFSPVTVRKQQSDPIYPHSTTASPLMHSWPATSAASTNGSQVRTALCPCLRLLSATRLHEPRASCNFCLLAYTYLPLPPPLALGQHCTTMPGH